ncbi:Acetate transporter [Penicillium ucsense]|uniref:Acetate transporter n=1 Tax=Penicillium ucsense TaxID=2839758 RepID=A0A8J8WF19_9EURO|nr:Acetate transporter [Penicillium ucsense]KAF7733450.1 Acetate transporter [Penicillium ucsense]
MASATKMVELQQIKGPSEPYDPILISDSQSSTPICSQLLHDHVLMPSPFSATTTPILDNGEIVRGPPRHVHNSQDQDLQRTRRPRAIANPAPLGLCAFGLTAFVSNMMNVRLGLSIAAENVASALIYGGAVQLMVGMWEIYVGNTFSATSFGSYGAYWISFGLLSNLEKNDYVPAYDSVCQKETLMGIFLMAWFTLTTLLLLCTLKTNLATFLLFLFLDLNYLFLAIAHLHCTPSTADTHPPQHLPAALLKTGGSFGLLAALAAWYNAFAGIFDARTGFFDLPVGVFPWAEDGDGTGRVNAKGAQRCASKE